MRELSVSPVLNLQQIADETVACTTLHKVTLCSKEGLCSVVAMFLQEVVKQRELTLLLHLMNGHGINHWLNHATIRGDDQDLIGLNPKRNTLLLPDRLEPWRMEEMSK